jgi:hypothetical protein
MSVRKSNHAELLLSRIMAGLREYTLEEVRYICFKHQVAKRENARTLSELRRKSRRKLPSRKK